MGCLIEEGYDLYIVVYFSFRVISAAFIQPLVVIAIESVVLVQLLMHVMVDEYQDVNPAQEVLITELHKLSETLFVVGDDDQAVYAWRGADVSNIIGFEQRYSGCSRHTLSKNFRSTQAIVAAADSFVA